MKRFFVGIGVLVRYVFLDPAVNLLCMLDELAKAEVLARYRKARRENEEKS